MSNLKEEWSSLMKLRSSGSSDQRSDSLRTRIFNNFITPTKSSRSNLYPIDEIPSTSPLSNTFYDKSLQIFNRTCTPEPQQNFEFGLKILKPDPKKTKLPPRTKTDEVWKIEDYPHKDTTDEFLPDRFEVLSIASTSAPAKSIAPANKLCVFSDFSPISRQICNLTFEEEQNFLKESKKHESFTQRFIHLLHQEADFSMFDKINWTVTRNLGMGFLFKSDFLCLLDPNLLKNKDEVEFKVNETIKEKIETSLKKESFVRSVIVEDEISELEKEMIEMLESLNSKTSGGSSDEKISTLLGIVEEKIRGSREAAGNMQLRVLYQFLLEYKKAKEERSKSNSAVSEVKGSKKSSPEKGIKLGNAKLRRRKVKGNK